ncbi:MAG TPA: ATP-binding protein, partial [Cyclobacteriaceae bacterium]|nr:ATP-binding protein [Cyclobacteriaceae bacterium]
MNDLRESFFDQAGEALVILDKSLRFTDVNEAFVRTTNLKRDQIIGRHITEVSPGIEHTERYLLCQTVLQTGKPIFIDETRTHPGLGNYVSRINVFKLDEGIGMAIQNITDLKETIDELETFIYESSHNLRGPVSSILGLADLAIKETNQEVRVDYFQMVQQKARLLDSILSRLMDTASIRKEEKTIHLIDFNEIIQGVKEILQPMRGFSDVHFEENILMNDRFYSDRRLLHAIFYNLIENAVKYKQDRGNAFVKTKVITENGGVTIVVADNGIGIADHSQGKIFDLFFRATERANGPGLGLYTLKNAVRKLGGHITTSSKEFEGTSFTIHLPN